MSPGPARFTGREPPGPATHHIPREPPVPRMLDVSDEVRAEIGDEEADRLLAGENAPGSYDCTSCRTQGDSEQERTSTVLFIGDETAVLAFAHASCLPSQVVQVTEEQLRGAVKSITGDTVDLEPDRVVPEQAVLGVTSGLVLIAGELHPALVVEPTGPDRAARGDGARRRLPAAADRAGVHAADGDLVRVPSGAARLVGAARRGPAARGAPARRRTAGSRWPGGRRTSRSRSPRAGGRPPTSTSRC